MTVGAALRRQPAPRPGRPVRIGLLWHSMTSDNLGVGALTLSQIAIVEEVAAELGLAPEFVVLGWEEPQPPYLIRPDLSIRGLRLRDFLRPRHGLAAAARSCDLVLDIGLGDSFADIYGAGRVLKMITGQWLVTATGTPLVLSPQTIGPFARRWLRRLALASMRRARAVATRDRLSTAFAREMGFSGPLVEATDVALKLPYRAPPPRPRGGPVRVGLNISGLLWSGGYSGTNMFGLKADYPRLMRRLGTAFSEMPDVELHLIGHVISMTQQVEDDRRAAARLATLLPDAVLAPAFRDPSEAKSYISSMDFFVGARMHACIAALSAGVPVVPLAYSRKFEGLFGTLGYDHVADCRTLDEAAVRARVLSGFEQRDRLAAEARAARARGLALLRRYEDTLRTVLGEVAGAAHRAEA